MSWQSACIVTACTSSIELTCPRTCGEREGALESVLALRVGIARATYHLARNMRHRRVLGCAGASAAAAAAATAASAPCVSDSAVRVHVPPLCPCQRAGVQRRCAELRRLQRRLTVANAHMVLLVVLVLRPVKLHRRILRTAKQHAEHHAVAAS